MNTLSKLLGILKLYKLPSKGVDMFGKFFILIITSLILSFSPVMCLALEYCAGKVVSANSNNGVVEIITDDKTRIVIYITENTRIVDKGKNEKAILARINKYVGKRIGVHGNIDRIGGYMADIVYLNVPPANKIFTADCPNYDIDTNNSTIQCNEATWEFSNNTKITSPISTIRTMQDIKKYGKGKLRIKYTSGPSGEVKEITLVK